MQSNAAMQFIGSFFFWKWQQSGTDVSWDELLNSKNSGNGGGFGCLLNAALEQPVCADTVT